MNIENVSLLEGKKIFGNRAVIGGFDNTANGILYRGSKEEIENFTEQLLKDVGTTGVILGADCTVPSDIDLKHLAWVREKAIKFSQKERGYYEKIKLFGLFLSIISIAVLGIACNKSTNTKNNVSQTEVKTESNANTDSKVESNTNSESEIKLDTKKDDNASPSTVEVTKVYVAHTQTYVPYDYVNEKGESDGFEVQVLKEVDELLPQYEFVYVPTSDDDLLIGVESGKYNIGTKGAWFTEERAKKFVFPKNYIAASSIGITFRTEDADVIKDLESFASFSGKLVPIAPQNAQYNVVEEYNKEHPDNQIDLQASDSFDVADAYTWVVEGRYDAFFTIKVSFENNVLAEDGAYHDYADKLSYVVYQAIPTWPLFNKNDKELADAYDEAITTLTENGRILELQEEYFGEDLFQYIKK